MQPSCFATAKEVMGLQVFCSRARDWGLGFRVPKPARKYHKKYHTVFGTPFIASTAPEAMESHMEMT